MSCATGLEIYSPLFTVGLVTLEDVQEKICELNSSWGRSVCHYVSSSSSYQNFKEQFCNLATSEVKRTALQINRDLRTNCHFVGIGLAFGACCLKNGADFAKIHNYKKISIAMNVGAFATISISIGLYIMANLGLQ